MDTTRISTMSEYLRTTLRTVSEGRERKYRSRPEGEARKGGPNFELGVVVRSIGYLDEHVKTGSGHEFIISEPVSVGGRDIAPWPLEYLLGGALGCFAAVYAFYASLLDVAYDEFEVTAKTWIDVRGHVIPGAPPSGFQKVELEIRVLSDAPLEKLREVERLALAGCPGIDTLRSPVPLTSTLVATRPGDGKRAAAE